MHKNRSRSSKNYKTLSKIPTIQQQRLENNAEITFDITIGSYDGAQT